jgi:oligopeptide transport system substrate-binding protein
MTKARSLGLAVVALTLVPFTACSTENAPGVSEGNSYSVGIDEPDHLTPGQATGAFDEVHALFAPLVKLDENNELTYVQAKSVTSSDNVHWTIKIRPGWTFHNGEPVTAQSYVDAWNTTAYGPNAWGNNGQFATIEGYDAMNPAEGEPTAKTLSGVTVVDPTTISVTLKAPDSQFPYRLTPSEPGFYPMPEAAYDDLKAYDEAPIGNGPFQMDGTWQHDVEIRMTRFDDYKGPQPQADGLLFKIYSDTTTAYTDARAGEVDIVSVPQEKYTQLEDDFGDHYVAFDAVSVDWLGFPLWDERYQDKRLREAISLAINRDEINEQIFGNLYAPAQSLTPPTAIGGGTTSCGDACDFDPERARQLLEAAGGWDGTLQIWYPGGVGYEQTFRAIANQIRENLGIEAEAKAVQGFTAYIAALDNREVTGPFRGHWGSLYPSMQNNLTALFTEHGEGQSGSGFYSNPRVDDLIAQGNAAPSPEAAVTYYKQAEQVIMDDFPVVPTFYAKYVYAYSDNVDNVIIGHDQIELTEVTVHQ